MTEELAQPVTVVSPRTGEVLSLDSEAEELGRFLTEVREVESLLRESKSVVNRELLRRMDFEREWTIHAPGMKLSAPSSKPVEGFDAPALREALLTLVDKGELPIKAVDAAVETVVLYKVKKAGVEALRKGGGRAAEIVDACSHEEYRERYVKVTQL